MSARAQASLHLCRAHGELQRREAALQHDHDMAIEAQLDTLKVCLTLGSWTFICGTCGIHRRWVVKWHALSEMSTDACAATFLHVCRSQRAEGAEVEVSGLAADANAAAARLEQVEKQARQCETELQRQLCEKETALASLHKQVLRWHRQLLESADRCDMVGIVTFCTSLQEDNLPGQVDSLDTRLATMAGQGEAASSAQELLRSQLAAVRAEAQAAEERTGAARAAHAAKSQECTR